MNEFVGPDLTGISSFSHFYNVYNRGLQRVTPLTKLGELGLELVYNCVLMSKTEVQVKDEIKTCHFHRGFTKKIPVLSIKSCK